ncbi:hypothetical protein WJX74_001854 [Apatococcus lobatus]|uniref:Uncharacterized protein n=1 Tax=Apatococcus lobatus TaxID=904363 RepID=A0AAW1QM66_9CHLO
MDSLRSQYLPSSPQDGAYHMDNQSVPPVPYARAELETIIRKYAVRFLKVDLTTEDMSPENVRLTSAELGFLLLQIERALRSEITREDPENQAASAAAPEAPHSKGKKKRVPQTKDTVDAMEKQRNQLIDLIADVERGSQSFTQKAPSLR